jgi:hypothetical protein
MNDMLKIFDWLNLPFLDIFQIETRTGTSSMHDVEKGYFTARCVSIRRKAEISV